MNDFEEWDPVKDGSDSGRGGAASQDRSLQRRALFEIRDRLQRAIVVGGHFNVVERHEERVDAFMPSVAARHKVIGDESKEEGITFASNSATALLLSRQFESLSRKDLMLLEQQELNYLMFTFFQTTRWRLSSEHAMAERTLAARVEDLSRREQHREGVLTSSIEELENACRRRTEAAAAELSTMLTRELHRAFEVLGSGQAAGSRHWLIQNEERARHTLLLESDRAVSRLFGQQISEYQNLVLRRMLRDKVPHQHTALVGAGTPSPKQQENPVPSANKEPAAAVPRTTPLKYDKDNDSDASGDYEIVPRGYPQTAESERSSSSNNVLASAHRYAAYWGSLWKSAGTLSTWQRRFFVFTQRGKMKFATSDKGPWTPLFSASQIVRIEIDAVRDGSSGSRPPADQYHNYCFFVDYDDGSVAANRRPARVRFCCYNRKELNSWMAVLRHASDVVFELEEQGSLARSPYRRHLDPAHLLAANIHLPGLSNASLSPSATYRKRTQLQEDLLSLEHQQAMRAKSPPPTDVHHGAVPPVSQRFGKAPLFDGKVKV